MSRAVVYSSTPSLAYLGQGEKQWISLGWTKLCGQKIQKSLGKSRIFREKKNHSDVTIKTTTCSLVGSIVVNTRGHQGSLRNYTAETLYPFLQEGRTRDQCGEMEMPPVALHILKKEILWCWDVYAGGLMKDVRRNYAGARKARLNRGRRQTDAVPTEASTNQKL